MSETLFNAIRYLVVWFTLVSLFDASSVAWFEVWWEEHGYNKDRTRLYQISTFGSWYLAGVAYLFTSFTVGGATVVLFCQFFLHLAGLEDILYALWGPVFGKKWDRSLSPFRFLAWTLPSSWPWLGIQTGRWRWLSNWWLVMWGGKQVSTRGLLLSIAVSLLIVELALIVFLGS